MKVLRLHGPHHFQLHDEPTPTPAPGESLIRISAVGICGSDLHWFEEASIGDADLERPMVLGHEFAGQIISGSHAGKRAAVDPAAPCNKCVMCLEGNPNLCLDLKFAGHGPHDGAFRQYISWPDTSLFSLPDALSDEDGLMLEPLGIAVHAVDLAHIKPGMSVSIHGCGPIGLLILQVAKAAGAALIIATDKLEHRLMAASQYGATECFQANDQGDEREPIAAAAGYGVDVAFEAAGENPAVESAAFSVKPGGRIIIAGIPSDDQMTLTASTIRRKGLTIKIVRRMKHTYPRAIQLVQRGLVDVRSLITHRYIIDEYEKAFDTAQRREGLKVIITP